MQLPYSLDGLARLNPNSAFLEGSIRTRRAAIRYHRDQVGDDRCWLDDFLVWQMVEGSPPAPVKVSPADIVHCEAYYMHRRTVHKDAVPLGAITAPEQWDKDLSGAGFVALLNKLFYLQVAIAAHCFIGDRPRTVDDDRRLYMSLPENLPADMRLPPREEFLGMAKAPNAGCPSFLASHAGCSGPCALSQWGPCSKKK